MPASRKFTNDNLNIISYKDTDRHFSNQNLRDEHPPDIIDDIEDEHPPDVLDDESESTAKVVSPDEPDTWNEGFINSIMSGDAFSGTGSALKGYAKGAVLDIPSAVLGGVRESLDLATNPVGNIINHIKNAPEEGQRIYDTIMKSATEPEDFGRMMGQMTGQPIVTHGMIKAGPSVVRTAGAIAEPTGRFMRRHTPITGMPVVSPLAGRNLMKLERVTGRGIEEVGKRMRVFGKNGKVIGPTESPFVEGEDVPSEILDRIEPVASHKSNISEQILKSEEPEVQLNSVKSKPKARLNPDGTYTNLDTGEVVNWTGKPMAEPIPKPRVTIKNAPPNQRAKILRGMHDAVDVLFDNPVDREIFGAGQRMSLRNGGSSQSQLNIAQRFESTSNNVAQQYGLPIEVARKIVHEYNSKVRALSKDFPSYGENLNFEAPPFELFLETLVKAN